MDYYKIALILALSCCFAACKKKASEPVPTPKAAVVEGSTAPAGGMLNAPADYVKNLADDVEKAKAAKEIQEKVQQEHLKGLEQVSGGN